MYEIRLTRQAGKDLARVFRSDRRLYQRFLTTIQSISEDPSQGKPLHGDLHGLVSHRMGSYRILYEVHQKKLLIVVIDLGHRKDIYK